MNNKGTSICVFSAKGGVGKTITTLNLAGIFEVLNKRVLIIDFDLSGGGKVVFYSLCVLCIVVIVFIYFIL